jgi:hypothetical protein
VCLTSLDSLCGLCDVVVATSNGTAADRCGNRRIVTRSGAGAKGVAGFPAGSVKCPPKLVRIL